MTAPSLEAMRARLEVIAHELEILEAAQRVQGEALRRLRGELAALAPFIPRPTD